MNPVRQCVTVFLALAILGAAQPLLRIDSTDPARNLAPVRLLVSTRARAVDVTVAHAAVASYRSSIVSGRSCICAAGFALARARHARACPALRRSLHAHKARGEGGACEPSRE